MTPDQYLEAFWAWDGSYPAAAIEWGRRNPELATDALIAVTESTLDELEPLEDEDHLPKQLFVIFAAPLLLGDLGLERSHAVLLRLLKLPGRRLHQLLGDVVQREMHWILWRTCGGKPEGMLALHDESHHAPAARMAVINALVMGVATGGLDQDAIRTLILDRILTHDAIAGVEKRDAALAYAEAYNTGLVMALCALDLEPARGKVESVVRGDYPFLSTAFDHGMLARALNRSERQLEREFRDRVQRWLGHRDDHLKLWLAPPPTSKPAKRSLKRKSRARRGRR